MTAPTTGSHPEPVLRISGGLWANAWKIAAAVGVLGLAGALAGFTMDARRFAFGYLFAFLFFLTIGLGSTFFVLVQHLTSAAWSVTVRRTAEFFMSALPIMALLFLPVLLGRTHLYPWMNAHHDGATHGAPSAQVEHGATQAAHGGEHAHAAGHGGSGHGHVMAGHGVADVHEAYEAAHEQHLMHEKSTYLNVPFFMIRALLYFGIWAFITMKYFRLSTSQDGSRDHENTRAAQRFSPIAMGLFALTLTFSAFDWIMSMDPVWYSTIFGVWIFAGSVVTTHALFTLVTLGLKRSGYLGDTVNTEHYHDLGKLTFGFLVFWAYISFSQFFLIWYASIPEETRFFHMRWADGPWKTVSLALLVVHFVLPFWTLISRNTKRRMPTLAIGASIVVLMHIVEYYWIVLPNYRPVGSPGFPQGYLSVSWMDIAAFLGVGGIYLAAVFFRMTRHPLIPVGDPRLARALRFENA